MLVALLPLLLGQISPADTRIAYVGRFDQSNRSAPACQWSASEVRLKVRGKTLVADISESGNDGWQVWLDGKQGPVIAPHDGVGAYTIDLGGDVIHEVSLVKRTEPFVGTTTFAGFDVPGGELLNAKPKAHQIQFIGDSITCGYGNEGPNQNEHFKPETENASMSYASIAARALDADPTIIAWSGRKMWPDNTVPEIYDRILPTKDKPVYNFEGPAPQVIVINLATNDFGKGNPDEKGWTDAYEAFIKRLWGHYPKAHIYAAIGSMMNDSYPPGQQALTTVRSYLAKMVDRIHDKRLHLIEFEPQKMEDGLGSDWHPNVKTHEKMAAVLVEAVKRDLKWH